MTVTVTAQGLAFQFQPVRTVQQAVEDGIDDGGFTEIFVPVRHGQLTGDQGCPLADAIIDDFQQVTDIFSIHGDQTTIVEEQEIDLGESVQIAAEAPITVADAQIFQQAR